MARYTGVVTLSSFPEAVETASCIKIHVTIQKCQIFFTFICTYFTKRIAPSPLPKKTFNFCIRMGMGKYMYLYIKDGCTNFIMIMELITEY